jgi:release factor glutamine methyltransferase
VINSRHIPTIKLALNWAEEQLQAISESARLDAEILLAQLLQVSRSNLFAWPDNPLTVTQQNDYIALVERRAHGEPLAYITGQREFWSLAINVTPDTLIPRPESELLVELMLEKIPGDQPVVLADLGTGSGALALALASARPDWIIHATDRVTKTLAVAIANATRLQFTNIIFHEGFWCDALPPIKFDAIISNPPYIENNDPELSAAVARFEPGAALLAGEAGSYLKSGGYLLLEHGARQSAVVTGLLVAAGFLEIMTYTDLAGLPRVTQGRWV